MASPSQQQDITGQDEGSASPSRPGLTLENDNSSVQGEVESNSPNDGASVDAEEILSQLGKKMLELANFCTSFDHSKKSTHPR